MRSEAQEKADFSKIRYAQCWEDADILLPALRIGPESSVVSIASAGDNTLSILACNPRHVHALDLSAPQLACLDFRVACFRCLNHGEMLQLLGIRPCGDRNALYQRIRAQLKPEALTYWDSRPEMIAKGIAGCGKFEDYFSLFAKRVIPMIHSSKTVKRLLMGGSPDERREFYRRVWNNRRWGWLFRLFFSRTLMGRLGRDPSFFQYVEGSVADRILSRTRYALTELNPAENPYLHWILTGTYGEVLPHYLRPENFESIRSNLHRLTYSQEALEAYIQRTGPDTIDAFNLSDIFEYMSEDQFALLYGELVKASRPGARLVYWNMLAPRSCPEEFRNGIAILETEALDLFKRDKAFFYSAFRVEEVRK